MALKDARCDQYQFEPIGLKCFFAIEPDGLKTEMTSQFCVQAQNLHNVLVSQIAELLRDEIKRCRLPYKSVENLTDLILSLFCGIVMRKYNPNTPAEANDECHVNAALETAFNVLLRG